LETGEIRDVREGDHENEEKRIEPTSFTEEEEEEEAIAKGR
jgi:hypothetical protein